MDTGNFVDRTQRRKRRSEKVSTMGGSESKATVLECMIKERRPRHPTPVFLPGKSHGQRSLVGCSPWGR